jgi:integrase
MKEMCNKEGLEGNSTNQSGKRTCATHLYQSGLDEQQIMSRAGHRSSGVRKYKRASNDQVRDLSNILEPPCSKKSENY